MNSLVCGLGVFCAVSGIAVTGVAMTTSELQNAINAAADGARVELTGDVELEQLLNVNGRKLTIASPEGTRHVIRRTQVNGFLQNITDGETDVRFENVEYDGNKAAYGSSLPNASLVTQTAGTLTLGPGTLFRDAGSSAGGTMIVLQSGRLVMEEGAEIRGFSNSSYGFAVRIGGSQKNTFDDGRFVMTGGRITACSGTASGIGYGGVVYLWGGMFEMSGGTITANTNLVGVAGVNVYSGSFKMCNDATVFGNVGGLVDDHVFSSTYPHTHETYVFAGFTGRLTTYDTGATQGARSGIWCGPSGTKGARGLGNVSLQGHPDWVLDGFNEVDGYTEWGMRALHVTSRGTMASIGEYWGAGSPYVKDNDVVTFHTNVVWAGEYDFIGVTNILFRSDENGPWTIARTEANSLFWDFAAGSARFENIIIDGRGEEYPITVAPGYGNADYSLLRVYHDAQVTFGAGTVLRNARSNQRAPGVVVDGTNSVFRMEEGSMICDCVADGTASYATAVMVGNGGSAEPRPRFEMAGGVISNCTCEIDTSSYSVWSGYGGVVYVYGGVCALTGGRITGNHSTTTCSGVQYYYGYCDLSGTARIEGNDGPYPDLYVRNGSSANVRIVDEFRGRVGVSNTSIVEGSISGVTRADGATGAWGIFPSLQGGSPHFVGGGEGSSIIWAKVQGTIDDIEFARKEDAELGCPRKLVLDERGRQELPHLFSGVATGVNVEVALEFDVDEMLEALRVAGSGLVLFRATGTDAFSGTFTFSLPEGAAKYMAVAQSGAVCKLVRRNGTSIMIR